MRPPAYLEVGLQGLPGGTSDLPAQLPHQAAPSSIGGVFPVFSPTECCANTWKLGDFPSSMGNRLGKCKEAGFPRPLQAAFLAHNRGRAVWRPEEG